MRLKTLVKHLIMQFPGIFPNALSVYNHLFYVIGNGYEWKDGVLYNAVFKEMTEEECVKEMIQFHNETRGATIKSLEKWKEEGKLNEDLANKLISRNEDILQKCIEKETYIIKHAAELSEDFTVSEDFILPDL